MDFRESDREKTFTKNEFAAKWLSDPLTRRFFGIQSAPEDPPNQGPGEERLAKGLVRSKGIREFENSGPADIAMPTRH